MLQILLEMGLRRISAGVGVASSNQMKYLTNTWANCNEVILIANESDA